ncbi:hypothetical protein HYQ46_011045 [Verticillium longisporum]|nr:hypothetical protein HYQ46_011045 [Verticillium longisporum]
MVRVGLDAAEAAKRSDVCVEEDASFDLDGLPNHVGRFGKYRADAVALQIMDWSTAFEVARDTRACSSASSMRSSSDRWRSCWRASRAPSWEGSS